MKRSAIHRHLPHWAPVGIMHTSTPNFAHSWPFGWSIAEKLTGRCQYPVAAISTLPGFAYHWPGGSLLIYKTGFPNSICFIDSQRRFRPRVMKPFAIYSNLLLCIRICCILMSMWIEFPCQFGRGIRYACLTHIELYSCEPSESRVILPSSPFQTSC